MSIVISQVSYAQSFQFSQYNFTQQRINPAAVSMSDYARAAIDYRNQSTAGDFNLNSTYLELSYPLIASNGGKRWSGLGVSFLDDKAGQSGLFKISEIGLSYAVNVFLSENQTLNLGFRTVYQSRRVSFDGLFTGSQFVLGRGFDNALSSGESGAGLSQNFLSFSSGLAWQKLDKEGEQVARFDVSVFDFNKPDESFFETNNTLPSTFVASGGFLAYKKDAFQVFPEVLFTSSASRSSVNVGSIVTYNFEDSPYAINATGKVHMITKYVLGKYFIAGLQFEKQNFKVGVSYDIPVGGEQVGNQGALEFGAEIKNLVVSRFKTRRQKVKRSRNRSVKNRRVKNRRIKLRKLRARRRKLKRKKSNKRNKTEQLVAENKEDKKVLNEEENKIEEVKSEEVIDSDAEAVEEVLKERVETSEEDVEEQIEQDTVGLSARAGDFSRHPLKLETTRLRFHFEFDSFVVGQESKDYLDDLSNILKQDPLLKVEIIGHTDYKGTEAYNQRLSERRAGMVKGFLIDRGISADRITTSGRGELEPLEDNTTDEGRRINRRVEFILTY